jgi:hypothetical protein
VQDKFQSWSYKLQISRNTKAPLVMKFATFWAVISAKTREVCYDTAVGDSTFNVVTITLPSSYTEFRMFTIPLILGFQETSFLAHGTAKLYRSGVSTTGIRLRHSWCWRNLAVKSNTEVLTSTYFYEKKFLQYVLLSYIYIYIHTPTHPVVPPYLWVTRSKIYRSYVKPRIIPNAIYNYNVLFV